MSQVHEVQVKLTVEQNVGRHGPLICMLMSFEGDNVSLL